MEFGQLRTLICVAELGSLSKAGDRLRIAQPALSRQVRMLEEELGVALFTRHGRGMVLTEQGREVLAGRSRVGRDTGKRLECRHASERSNRHWAPRDGRGNH